MSETSSNAGKPASAYLFFILWGHFAACIVCSGLLLALAGVMTARDLPPQAIDPLCVICAALGCLCGGYLSARRAREKGMLLGMLCAGTAFLVLLVISLLLGEKISFLALIKLLSMLLGGAAGGVLGVNQKIRRR